MAGFLKNKTAVAQSGGGGGYLNPSKIPSGGSARFALLTDEPLEFWETWGESTEGQLKPFRFLCEPTADDIEAEFGEAFSRRQNREGTAWEAPKFGIAVPVYDFEAGSVKILSLTQKGLIRELDSISQMEDYENLLEWDFSLSKEGSGLTTEYTLRPVPRKKGSQDGIDKAWKDAQVKGFDITKLMTGENPFGS